MARQQIVHEAFEIWRKVLDDHKRHAGVNRHIGKKLFQSTQAACRGTDTDNM
jgi:hypothetical protein